MKSIYYSMNAIILCQFDVLSDSFTTIAWHTCYSVCSLVKYTKVGHHSSLMYTCPTRRKKPLALSTASGEWAHTPAIVVAVGVYWNKADAVTACFQDSDHFLFARILCCLLAHDQNKNFNLKIPDAAAPTRLAVVSCCLIGEAIANCISQEHVSTYTVHVISYLRNYADLLHRCSADFRTAACRHPWTFHRIIAEMQIIMWICSPCEWDVIDLFTDAWNVIGWFLSWALHTHCMMFCFSMTLTTIIWLYKPTANKLPPAFERLHMVYEIVNERCAYSM